MKMLLVLILLVSSNALASDIHVSERGIQPILVCGIVDTHSQKFWNKTIIKEYEQKMNSCKQDPSIDDQSKVDCDSIFSDRERNHYNVALIETSAAKKCDEDAKKKAKAVEVAAIKQAAKPGARLGMTQKQVVTTTNWGKPQSVNRTTSRRGTREQWVYGNGNYLYFEDGILTTIQN